MITNITLRDSPFWTLHPYDCKNITIRNVTILAPVFEAPNTDGIDPGKLTSTSQFNFIYDVLSISPAISALCRPSRLLHFSVWDGLP